MAMLRKFSMDMGCWPYLFERSAFGVQAAEERARGGKNPRLYEN